jgi:hypothetical protein
MKVNGVDVASGSASGAIGLNVGTNTITIAIAAQDGVATMTYSVAVTRAPSVNANLSALTLSAGILTPSFASGTTAYAASVSHATASLSVTPTLADALATVQVNGVAIVPGAASGAISLNVGLNVINIVVTAQDGATVQTYSVNLTRRTPYQDWVVSLGLSGAAMDPMSDMSGNGLKNVLKWAFGMDLTSVWLPPVAINGNQLNVHGVPTVLNVPDGAGGVNRVVLFDRRKDAASVGLTYTVEFSSDLVGWTNSAEEPNIVAQDSEIEAVIVPFPPSANGFVRVRVTCN